MEWRDRGNSRELLSIADEDADLRRQIDDDLGVDVDRAAAGHRVRLCYKTSNSLTEFYVFFFFLSPASLLLAELRVAV